MQNQQNNNIDHQPNHNNSTQNNPILQPTQNHPIIHQPIDQIQPKPNQITLLSDEEVVRLQNLKNEKKVIQQQTKKNQQTQMLKLRQSRQSKVKKIKKISGSESIAKAQIKDYQLELDLEHESEEDSDISRKKKRGRGRGRGKQRGRRGRAKNKAKQDECDLFILKGQYTKKKDTVAPMPETITHKSSQKNTIKSSKPEKTILTQKQNKLKNNFATQISRLPWQTDGLNVDYDYSLGGELESESNHQRYESQTFKNLAWLIDQNAENIIEQIAKIDPLFY